MRLSSHHKELKDGKGKCSVPMWQGGFATEETPVIPIKMTNANDNIPF